MIAVAEGGRGVLVYGGDEVHIMPVAWQVDLSIRCFFMSFTRLSNTWREKVRGRRKKINPFPHYGQTASPIA
jgi:hypothetical protein